jgi:predicted  nucleic acid-binding Zn-ribbon protein
LSTNSDGLFRKETEDLEKAQSESDAAYAEYKKVKLAYAKAQDDSTSEEEVAKLRDKMYDLEEAARAKEQTLRGLQDFCD